MGKHLDALESQPMNSKDQVDQDLGYSRMGQIDLFEVTMRIELRRQI